jgi:general stress protein 26
MLLGEIEILSDPKSRQRLWREACEMYYPLGVTDPDYSVLRFSAKSANYYHQLDNLTFAP